MINKQLLISLLILGMCNNLLSTVDINITDINAKDLKGLTALHHAAQKENLEEIKELLKNGADVHAKDLRNNTALLHAAKKGSVNIIQELLNAGADINAQNDEDFNALMLVAHYADPTKKSIENYLKSALILMKNGININHTRRHNDTAAHDAIFNCNHFLLYLIDKHSGDFEIRDTNDERPIDQAKSRLSYCKDTTYDPYLPYCQATVNYLNFYSSLQNDLTQER